MAKHKSLRDAIREKEFRKMIEDSLKKQYQRGLLVGSRSMLKVIGDKIAVEGQTPEEKLAEVMKIINNMLTMTDQTEKQAEESSKAQTEELFSGFNTDEEPEEAAEEYAPNVVEFPTEDNK